jgi:hypothetical protein
MLKTLLAFAGAMLMAIAGASPAVARDDLVYADSHAYSPTSQPPRYWTVGVTSKPPPKGVHPEYAHGKPDGQLAGWARKKGNLILGFGGKEGLRSADGPDLFVWHFGPGGTRVYASMDPKVPATWYLLGELDKIDGHAVHKSAMEFGSLDKVHFIKFEKWEGGIWGKGRFIDAVAGSGDK